MAACRESAGMLVPIHVAAGGLAILLGAAALAAKKGGTIHRRAGLLFVYAMLVMAISASILGVRSGGLTDGNAMVGGVTAYFVGTAWMTVRRASTSTRRINAVALTFVLVLALAAVFNGLKLIDSPGRDLNGVPHRTAGVMSFVLATVMLLAAIGDIRQLRSGPLRGGRRLGRHLWRMCFALFIAAGSFFSIPERVARILPEPLTTGSMRALPILLLFATMFYWLWKVRVRRILPRVILNDPILLDTPAK